jgi:hypothetical protein
VCIARFLQDRKLPGMTNDARLEIRIPAQQRQELLQLARETGVTVPGLVRLATRRLLEDRSSLLREARTDEANGAAA